ncbi:hypothetical protein I4F81_007558 [Pyropia yezoensis]|uniref:Uncharacterized protein n=1 Tax=Pyropia yezoensis TaxID=2788 RepID=A0ACC3C4D2_PYRYE|nr:hypothetical protein I4F81_007558 [Neopyropia yezoensis]
MSRDRHPATADGEAAPLLPTRGAPAAGGSSGSGSGRGNGGGGGDGSGAPMSQRAALAALVRTFFVLGVTAFGGPPAHMGLMHAAFTRRPEGGDGDGDGGDGGGSGGGGGRKLTVPDAAFVELFALASALPGPSSTQLAAALGATFAGIPGALAALSMWILPAFTVLTAVGSTFYVPPGGGGGGGGGDGAVGAAVETVTHYAGGFIAAATAHVVLAALAIVRRTVGGDGLLGGVAVVSTAVGLLVPPARVPAAFGGVLLLGAAAVSVRHATVCRGWGGAAAARGGAGDDSAAPTSAAATPAAATEWTSNMSRATGAALLGATAVATAVAVVALHRPTPPGLWVAVPATFWLMGVGVFGGGLVLLPMIIRTVVEASWLPAPVFLTGFALSQTLPGPLFNLSAFVGAAVLGGLPGAAAAAGALFAPGLGLLLGVLPYWESLRGAPALRRVLTGVNAAAAGLIIGGVYLLAARALRGPAEFCIAVAAAAVAIQAGAPPPATIVAGGVAGAIAVAAGVGGPF